MAKKEIPIMRNKHQHNARPYNEMSFGQLVKQLIISRLPKQKQKMSDDPIVVAPDIPEEEINYIAIVLDGVVEDVMRTQNRLAALLLSEPIFVEFDPKQDRPQIGETKYSEGKFHYPQNELMTEDEVSKILKGMNSKNED